jgi:hypothetical protein
MASDRQIQANRQNARKSTGPRSGAGKRRSSSNSLRHGLSFHKDERTEIEALARLIADGCADQEILEHAREAARAHMDLLRVREVKHDLIERMYAIGTIEPLRRFRSIAAEVKFVMRQSLHRPFLLPPPVNPLGPMPTNKDKRAAEAMRRLQPEMRKPNRYEKRAFNTKQTALRKLADYRRRRPTAEAVMR